MRFQDSARSFALLLGLLWLASSYAGPGAELSSPAAGWRYSGLLDDLDSPRVAYPTPPIDRGGQRGRSLGSPVGGAQWQTDAEACNALGTTTLAAGKHTDRGVWAAFEIRAAGLVQRKSLLGQGQQILMAVLYVARAQLSLRSVRECGQRACVD